MAPRIVISPFSAADASGQTQTEFAPGEAIAHCRIHRHSQAEVDAGAEPYIVRFEWAGQEFHASLPIFQARTQPAQAVREAGGETSELAV